MFSGVMPASIPIAVAEEASNLLELDGKVLFLTV
jgi:hypothetical protein